MTPTCTSCGAELSQTARFCRSCGAPASAPTSVPDAPLRCARCGTDVINDACFCHACGAAVGAPEPEPESESVSTSCASCGGRLDAEARFCRHCGTPLEDRRAAPDEAAAAQPGIAAEVPQTVLSTPAASSDAGAAIGHPQREPDEDLDGQPTIVTAASRRLPDSTSDRLSCSVCQAPVSHAARFCRSCGAEVDHTAAAVILLHPTVRTCPGCQSEVEDWAGFCRHCGVPLASEEPDLPSGTSCAACTVCGAATEAPSSLCANCVAAMGTG